MRPFAHLALGAASAVATFYVAAFSLNSLVFRYDSTLIDFLYALAVIALSGCAAWLVVRKLRQRTPWVLLHVPRWGWGLLLAAYAATWAFGVPAAQAHDQRIAVARWNHNREAGYPVHDTPSVSVVSGLPVLPGLVLSYQYVGVGPLDGWEGWTLHLWYGWGVADIGDLTLGVS